MFLFASAASFGQNRIDVRQFGARGDAREFADGYVAGSLPRPVLHSPASRPFVPGDMGKLVEIQNSCLNAGVVSTLEGTLASASSGDAAILAVDTSTPAHGIVCAAINTAPLLGTLQTAVDSSATSFSIYQYAPTKLPATPFPAVLGSGTSNQETVTVTAVFTVYGQSLTLTVARSMSPFSHAAGQSVLLTGNQAVQYAYGTDDTAAINRAIASALAGASSSSNAAAVYFSSSAGGYMARMQDKTSPAAGANCAICVDGSNLTLYGDPTTLYAAGAFSVVKGKVLRGNAIQIGEDRKQAYTNITLRKLVLDGMTNGNTDIGGGMSNSTGDGWDITNKGITTQGTVLDDGIVVDDVKIRDFKGEEVYGGGHRWTIQNSEIENTNGDCISVSSLQFTITDNILDNAAADCVENGVFNTVSFMRITNNKISNCLANGIVLPSVSNSPSQTEAKAESSTGAKEILIKGNAIAGCGTTMARPGPPRSCVDLTYQHGSSGTVSNVTVSENTLLDFQAGINVDGADHLTVSGNVFSLDTFRARYAQVGVRLSGAVGGAATCNYCEIADNRFIRTASAVSNSLTYYPIQAFSGADKNPYWTGVRIVSNLFDTGSNPYNAIFGASLAAAWSKIQNQAASWSGNTCRECPFNKNDVLQAITAAAPTIYPVTDWVHINPNSSFPASITTSRVQADSELRITNVSGSSHSVTFANDGNMSLQQGPVTLAVNREARFRFSGSSHKWELVSTGP